MAREPKQQHLPRRQKIVLETERGKYVDSEKPQTYKAVFSCPIREKFGFAGQL